MFNRGFLSSMIRNFVGLTAAGGLAFGAAVASAPATPSGNSPEPGAGGRECLAALAWDYVREHHVVSGCGLRWRRYFDVSDSGRRACERGSRRERARLGRIVPVGARRAAARPQWRGGGESVGADQPEQAAAVAAGGRTGERREAGPHHRQRPDCAGRFGAAAAGCFLRRAWAVVFGFAIFGGEDDGASERARAGGGGQRSERRVGCGARGLRGWTRR